MQHKSFFFLPPSVKSSFFLNTSVLQNKMINKNLRSVVDQPQESPNLSSPRPLHNTTTNKQRNSMSKLQQNLYPQSPHGQDSIQDRLIEPQPDLYQRQYPENISLSPQRRSMIKQNELWSVQSNLRSHSRQELLFISDEYYNENVPNQTLFFLQRIRGLLVKQEESLSAKRKVKLQAVLFAIRAQFARLRDELIGVVNQWSRRAEQEELEYFIRKGELEISGQVVELAARMGARREDIEKKIAQLNSGLSESHMVSKEEALKRNHLLKTTVREVWSRNYEYEVSELQQEAAHIRNYETDHHFLPQRFQQHASSLHLSIHNALCHHDPFKHYQAPITLAPSYLAEKMEDKSLSPASAARREQILQSLMEERVREVNAESQRIAKYCQL